LKPTRHDRNLARAAPKEWLEVLARCAESRLSLIVDLSRNADDGARRNLNRHVWRIHDWRLRLAGELWQLSRQWLGADRVIGILRRAASRTQFGGKLLAHSSRPAITRALPHRQVDAALLSSAIDGRFPDARLHAHILALGGCRLFLRCILFRSDRIGEDAILNMDETPLVLSRNRIPKALAQIVTIVEALELLDARGPPVA